MPVKKEHYDSFIRNLAIINVTLPSFSWQLHENPPEGSEIQNEIEFKIEDPLISDDHTEVILPAWLKVVGKREDKGSPLYEISILQHLNIAIDPKSFTDELLDLYVMRNGLLTMIPVFREHVRYASFQMGISPLILPAVKVMPPKPISRSTKKRKS